VIATRTPPRRSSPHRSLHLGSVATALAVGLLVWLAARHFASDSCPENDVLRAASSCRALIGSLAARVGATAGAAVLLMELLAAGLLRTAENMDRDRRVAAGEASSGAVRR